MPKKMGINTKAAEARARIEAVKQSEKSRKEEEAEAEKWLDTDKSLLRKQQRKDEKEKKKNEVLERKTANKAVYEDEMSSVRSAKPAPPSKVTRADIEKQINNIDAKAKTGSKSHREAEVKIEENVNREIVEGEARSVDDAISVLSLRNEPLDRHPERRVKAAYEAYEAANLPRIKSENPNLRLSQLKQLLKKEWMKSPENPLNQLSMKYNDKINQ